MSDLAIHPQELGIGRLFESVRDAVIVADAETGRIVLWNPAATEVFGYPLPEALEMSVEALVPEPLRAQHRAGMSRYRDTGHGPYIDSGSVLELPAVRKGGEEIYIELSLSPIEPVHDSEGKGRFVLAVVRDVTERKRAEEALRASETELRALFAGMTDVILVLDKEGRYLEIAPTNPSLLYKPPAELVGRTLHEVLPKAQADSYLGCIRSALETHQAVEIEYSLEIGGREICFAGTVSPMLEDRVIWVARDVTEHKEAQEALRRSEASLAEAQRIAHIGNWEWDVRTDQLYWSDEVFRIYGYEPQEFVPTLEKLMEVVHPGDRGMLREKIEGTLRHGEPYDFEHRVVRPDGMERIIHRRAEVVCNEEGEPLRLVGTVQDMTERKRAEEEIRRLNEELEGRVKRRTAQLEATVSELRENERRLRESEERFRLLVEGVKDYAIFMLDPEGRIASWNEGAQRIKGYEEDEVSGEHFSIFYTEGDLERGHPQEELRIAASEGRYEEEGLRVRKDGSRFWADVVITALRDQAGNLRGFSKVTRDVTARKEAEDKLRERAEELARSNAELEQFAYVASHDLQEPLRMVSSYTQLLARRYKGKLDSDADEFINYAVDGANRMQTLIQDLLQYSRVGTRGNPLAPTDTGDVFDAACANLRRAIQESGAEITSDKLPTVMGDEGQLVQLFQNLIGNAIKFRGEEPARVHVGAERRDGEWLFSVHDNGIGIDPQYAERIFVIFQRLHGKGDYSGTGIGLAVCKKIVERHDGKIWVESEPGNGSTFYFTLQDGRQRG